jgi:hypothetical protein
MHNTLSQRVKNLGIQRYYDSMMCVYVCVQRTLMLNDGCAGSDEAIQCNSVKFGLFKRGLHAVLQYFDTAARGVLASRLLHDGSTAAVRIIFSTTTSLEHIF